MDQSEKRKVFIFIGSIALLSFAAIGFMGWHNQGPSSSGGAGAELKSENCQSEVRKIAKYPSKAVFTYQDPIVNSGAVTQHLRGTVDFMNGFGAMIPHRYDCQIMEYSGTLIGVPSVIEEG
ncbi:hypothetical protein YA0745_12045 [Pseudomonas synxantha]|uniref:Uncharacterized protein n=1 Tax=Pseudomonas synxantha TaxID=47883 RepID=A0ABS0UCK1_9PSED|nr:hypothetical protein [Pseudomonas synxantha]MBI6563309.1 hypothetical protein [Pseudomonas synxantha]MBI6582113.1 hypothetical protein [Pseudomonas synxantha]MBI6643666.1 hypothetical protein [Pseudomonas synxantha]